MSINYDFVEIGTSDWATCIETATDTTVGISVEPLEFYLSSLPDKPQVKKVCAAIVSPEQYNKEGPLIDIYYIDPKTIEQYNIWPGLKGGNCVGKPHDYHTNYSTNLDTWHRTPPDQRHLIPSVNLLEKGLVSVKKVPCLTFEMLANAYDIGIINFLKTDTEGNDPPIITSVISYYIKLNRLQDLPRRIEFESNGHCDANEVEKVKYLLTSVGYECSSTIYDTTAILKL